MHKNIKLGIAAGTMFCDTNPSSCNQERTSLNNLPVQQEDRQPIGTIAKIHGPVVIIDCSRLPPLLRALSTHFDHTDYLFEVRWSRKIDQPS